MRVLIDLPDDELAELDGLARQNGCSRAAEVREAIRVHLRSRSGNGWIGRGAGYWRDRDDIGDGVDYQRRLRDDRQAG